MDNARSLVSLNKLSAGKILSKNFEPSAKLTIYKSFSCITMVPNTLVCQSNCLTCCGLTCCGEHHICSAVFRQFLIQYITAKELSEPVCCQVNHLMNYVKGNNEDADIYSSNLLVYRFTQCPSNFSKDQLSSNLLLSKLQERATAFLQVG